MAILQKKDTVVSAAGFKSRYGKVVNIIELMTAALTVSCRVYVFDPAIRCFLTLTRNDRWTILIEVHKS